MREGFVTRLGVQLHDAAEREARRGPARRAARVARSGVPVRPAVTVAGLVVAVVLVLAAGRALQDDRAAPTIPRPHILAEGQLVRGGGPLASGFGAVWALDTATSDLLRVDPATRAVRARIPVGAQPFVQTAAGAVWVLSVGRLLRIDPATNRVSARLALPPAAQGPGVLLSTAGSVWLATAQILLRLDPKRVAIRRTIDLTADGFQATSAVAGGGTLYVGRADGRLLAFDARSGARVSDVARRVSGFMFAMVGGRILAFTDHGLAAFAPDSGHTAWTRDLGTRGANAAVVQGDSVWAHAPDPRTGRDRLVRMDARTGRLKGSVPLREFGVAGMAAVGGQVWSVSQKGHLVVVA